MLYEDVTTGALVAGIEFESIEPWTARQAEMIREALREHNRAHGTELELIVPGDSTTRHAQAPDTQLYGWGVLIGLVPTSARDRDGVHEVDIASAHRALSEVRSLPRSYWGELAERHPLLEGIDDERPQLFLTSFGPRPAAVLTVGQKRRRQPNTNTTYQFFEASGRAGTEGVDGIDIAQVDFADFIEVDLSPAAVESWLSKVRKLDEPRLFLAAKDN